LYVVCTVIAIIIGIDSFMMAFFGSPSNVCIPFVSLLLDWLLFTEIWKERDVFQYCAVD